jgi:hypothetical protein
MRPTLAFLPWNLQYRGGERIHGDFNYGCLVTTAFSKHVTILWHSCEVECFSRKPNWYGEISLLSGTASSVLLRSGLSDTLAIMGRRLMGLYDVTSVGGFPGLDIMI